jgi:CRISPR/Cas system-associated endonuclease Cas3-HD
LCRCSLFQNSHFYFVFNPLLKEIKELINELQNLQEYLDIIHRDLREIKDYMPGMKWQIDEVLSKLNMPSSTVTQKLEIAIPIIPNVVSYKNRSGCSKICG